MNVAQSIACATNWRHEVRLGENEGEIMSCDGMCVASPRDDEATYIFLDGYSGLLVQE